MIWIELYSILGRINPKVNFFGRTDLVVDKSF